MFIPIFINDKVTSDGKKFVMGNVENRGSINYLVEKWFDSNFTVYSVNYENL